MTQLLDRATAAGTHDLKPRLLPTAVSFLGRDFKTARSYKISFVMSVVSLTMSLITFRFISKLVGDSVALAGIGNYFGFVVVGMAMSQLLEGSLTSPSGAVRQEQVQGTLEVLATTPMRPAAMAAGWLAYPLINALLTAVLMLSIAAPLGLQLGPHANLAGACLVFVASALAFAGLGILGAAVVLVIQQAATVTKWITAGLSLISGVFFPLSLFPGWVATLSNLSPLTHSLRGVRAALLQGAGLSALLPDLLALIAFAIVLLPISIGTLSLALRRARRTGSIATY
jgi:ABC-2 type transport system permease protein